LRQHLVKLDVLGKQDPKAGFGVDGFIPLRRSVPQRIVQLDLSEI
jgi:hypothetical protein